MQSPPDTTVLVAHTVFGGIPFAPAIDHNPTTKQPTGRFAPRLFCTIMALAGRLRAARPCCPRRCRPKEPPP